MFSDTGMLREALNEMHLFENERFWRCLNDDSDELVDISTELRQLPTLSENISNFTWTIGLLWFFILLTCLV